MPARTDVSVRSWVWQALVRSALIPLVLVETLLIAAYLFSNMAIRDANIQYLREQADMELAASAVREARIMEERLQSVEQLTRIYADETRQALLDRSYRADTLEAARYALSSTGIYYSTSDNGGAASFYSNITPIGDSERRKVLQLSQLDPLMRSIDEASPLVTAVYFNTHDSYNRIYPYFDVLDQYAPGLVIPDYNFYYLADAEHNPEREAVWTGVYLDPAGQGWMASCIAPVYRDDFLEGVVGLDITVQTFINQIQDLQIPWNGYAVLLNSDGDIMALPPRGEADWGLRELTTHSYQQAVRQESFKPEQFNIFQRPDTQSLANALRTRESGHSSVQLNARDMLLAWSTIPSTDWRLLTIVREQDVYAQTNALSDRFRELGYLLIGGLVAFYAIFFLIMWKRSRSLADQISSPLESLQRISRAIGDGDWHQQPPQAHLREMRQTGEAIVRMGDALAESHRALEASEERLQTALEASRDSIWEYDIPSGQFYVHDNLPRMLGYRPGEVPVNLRLEDLDRWIHAEDLPELQRRRREFLEGRTVLIEAEYRMRTRDDEWIWVLTRGRISHRDADHRPLRATGSHVNITQRKEVEQQLCRARDAADAANNAKTQFLSSITHELRTPLNAIMGFGQLLRQEVPDADSTQRAYLDEMLNAGTHLLELIDELLELSRIETGHLEIDISCLDPAPLVHEAVRMSAPDAQSRGLRLDTQLESGSLVQVDRRRLRQIVLNLLSNAIKYNSEQGSVDVLLHSRGDCLRLEVQDTGPGIDPERQEELFVPFNRLGREASDIKGAGIGLSITRELVQAMNGRIGLDSVPGQGSCFWVEFPLCPERQADSDSERGSQDALPGEDAVLRGKTVLIVEDNPGNAQLMEAFCRDQQAGCTLTAGTATEGLELAFTRQPDCILLDLNLPDVDGLTALHALRQDPDLRRCPVLVLTARADAESRQEALAEGAQAVLTKPLDLEQLRAQVARHLLPLSAERQGGTHE